MEMYCFAKICCLCLGKKTDFTNLEDLDENQVSFYYKLVVLIPEFDELMKKSIPRYICKKCKRYLNKLFKFRHNCLKSYQLLESYVGQLDQDDEDITQDKEEEAINVEEDATNVEEDATNVEEDTSNIEEESEGIEDDLILIKEDMEECLQNMTTFSGEVSHENSNHPNPETSCRKRTRECKKISYNEDYDSDTILSENELYYTRGAKRKAKPKKPNPPPKTYKTVVIPQNDEFAKDLTKIINGITAQLPTDHTGYSKPEEFKIMFRNSSGNTEQLFIYQNNDSIEIQFTKVGKLRYLRVDRFGDSFVLKHNVAETSRKNIPDTFECKICRKSFKSYYLMKKHLNNYMNFEEISCKICDRCFRFKNELKKHINEHSVLATPSGSSNDLGTEDPIQENEIHENGVKFECPPTPDFQFHLSDDSEDEFDNDTLILGTLDNGMDFFDSKSPSPVQLTPEVLDFFKTTDPENEESQNINSKVSGDQIELSSKDEEPETDCKNETENQSNNIELVNGNDFVEEKLLKIILNKNEVDDFLKNKNKTKEIVKEVRTSPRRQKFAINSSEVKEK